MIKKDRKLAKEDKGKRYRQKGPTHRGRNAHTGTGVVTTAILGTAEPGTLIIFTHTHSLSHNSPCSHFRHEELGEWSSQVTA